MLLILSCQTARATELSTPLPSLTPASPLHCYDDAQLKKLADGITDLKKCQVDLAARNELIQKHMLTMDGLNPGPAFWQEPSFVWGGMVVSVAVGGLATFLLLQNSK